jgi:DNA-binding transcriptional ArsR family regulator
VNIAEVGRMVGEPARAQMLIALLDGRALTATELAGAADVTRPTASAHLARLSEGGLLRKTAQGRHRYFRIAGPEVAAMLEGMLRVAAGATSASKLTRPRIDPALRDARTCYDHLAGRLGISLAEALVAKGALILTDEAGEITPSGHDLLATFGIPADLARGSRRLYCRPCMDWSERRWHLAGVLGTALLQRCLDLRWVQRALEGRAVTVTARGRRGFVQTFDFDFAATPATPPAVSSAVESHHVR